MWALRTQVTQLVGAGLAQDVAERLLAVAEEKGYGEVIRKRREEERRRAKEQERLAGIVMRASQDGVQRALLALQTSGAPPTATGFFVCHNKTEGEALADALGDDLILASEQVRAKGRSASHPAAPPSLGCRLLFCR